MPSGFCSCYDDIFEMVYVCTNFYLLEYFWPSRVQILKTGAISIYMFSNIKGRQILFTFSNIRVLALQAVRNTLYPKFTPPTEIGNHITVFAIWEPA